MSRSQADERQAPLALDLALGIRSLAAGGAGIADLPDGRVVFVQRSAPGDLARIQLTKEKRKWARGRLLELLEEGPSRRLPPCSYYDRCGGCTLQHLRYLEQLLWKGRWVRDALERIGGVVLDEPPPVEASPLEFRYRNRISFHLRRISHRRVVAGFHELEGPGSIVDVEGECLLPHEDISQAWTALRSGWGEGAELLPGGDGLRLTLRRVVAGVILVIEGGKGRGRPQQVLESVPGLVAVWWRRHRDGPVELLAGDPDTEETWLGELFTLDAGAFLQVNPEAAEVLQQAALHAVGPPRGLSIVDAYAGVGLLGRALARHGARVTAIELDGEAVAAARRRAPGGFTALQGRVEDLLAESLPADRVVLNPPRAGLHPGVCARLSESGVERVVYVSCDPATLARDVARLAETYEVVDVRCFDLFPQTAHVETLATLERRALGQGS